MTIIVVRRQAPRTSFLDLLLLSLTAFLTFWVVLDIVDPLTADQAADRLRSISRKPVKERSMQELVDFRPIVSSYVPKVVEVAFPPIRPMSKPTFGQRAHMFFLRSEFLVITVLFAMAIGVRLYVQQHPEEVEKALKAVTEKATEMYAVAKKYAQLAYEVVRKYVLMAYETLKANLPENVKVAARGFKQNVVESVDAAQTRLQALMGKGGEGKVDIESPQLPPQPLTQTPTQPQEVGSPNQPSSPALSYAEAVTTETSS